MKSVYFASSFWDDDFVFELNHVTKLFYIFLITNKNVLPSGMYKLGKIEKLKTGLTQTQIRNAFQELKGKIYVFGEWIFIKNLLYKSFLENSSEEKFKNSNIFKMVVGQLSKNNLPYQLVELFIENYPILTPYKPLQAPYKDTPPPLLHTDTDTDTESYTETEKNKAQKKRKNLKPTIVTQEKIEIPGWIDKQTWDAYLEMRKLIKKPLTKRASSMAIKKLEEFKAAGENQNKILEQSIFNSWQGLFSIKQDHSNRHEPLTFDQKRRLNNLKAMEEATID